MLMILPLKFKCVESDHGAVGVNVEWKVRRNGKCRMKGKSKRKRRLTARNWESNGFLYADDVCIMASNEQHLQTIFDNIGGCIKEYGIQINGKKSKVVCINGAKEERSWNFGVCEIGEVEEYKYLGVTVKAGLNGGLKSMGDRMVDANGVLGMVK